jgi:surface antigen
MRGQNWPAAAALAVALTGCHAIYGQHNTPAASPAATVQTPSDGARTTETPSGGSGATIGTLGGAAADRSLANSAVAAVAGTLAGGYFGNRLGIDDNTRLAAASAERQALTNNAPTDWSDPKSGTSGRVWPLRSFTDAAGRECREYSHTVNIAGRRQSDTGIACRRSSGDWSLVGG